ncbi:MAG: FtsQ-type POTRA domain-containing protein, partial [Candidatus Aminicenantes bacterium]|nr:FtsQ-type POTRA domain-containing protein [Candidatus Aminicenantes bacterium]
MPVQRPSMLRKLLIFAGRLLGTGLLLLGRLTALRHAAYSSQGEALFGIRDIRFEGARHLSWQKLRTFMLETYTGNILRVDLEQLKDLVESESWVRAATVRRQLPGHLIVSVRERVPVAVAAIDEDLYIVDEEG